MRYFEKLIEKIVEKIVEKQAECFSRNKMRYF